MAIKFSKHTLKNGLRLIIHPDQTTPLVSCNVVYNVGSRDEEPHHTGMAHLFEHFMFCGSKHIPDYDGNLQKVGAINNAYTSQDITHYYIILPADNLETALWLESDRMLELAFDEEQLQIQKQVVIEEFKENYLNRPFGNLWQHFHGLIYQNHPYQWLPIGKEISHIEEVTMDYVKEFYYRYYRPNNAVLVISGNVDADKVIPLVEKWFGDIPAGPVLTKNYPTEALQTAPRFLQIEEDVPYDLLIKGWLMCERLHPNFYAHDLISDMFGNGRSSYLYKKFVVEEQLFTGLSCQVADNFGQGYFVIMGTPVSGVSLAEADAKLSEYLYNFKYPDTLSHDLQKVKNRVATILLNNEIKLEDRSSMLAVSEILSRAEDFEHEKEKYFSVTEENVKSLTQSFLKEETANTLYYVNRNINHST